MFDFILGNEKAITGGLSAGILTLLSSVGITGQMTVKNAVYALAAWVVTHIVVYLTTNSKNFTLVNKADDLAEDVIKALHIVNDRVTSAANDLQAANAPQVVTAQTIPPEVAEAMAKELAKQAKQPDLHATGNADGSLDEQASASDTSAQTSTGNDTTAAPAA